MISHWNGNVRTIAARRADSLTSLRTTKRADRANVYDTELGHLLGDLCRSAPIRSTDIDCPKKNDPLHRLIVNG